MNLEFYTYHLPFKNQFHTSKKVFEKRKGVIIKLQKKGVTALGEAAPLPDFSKESYSDLLQQIRQYQKMIFELLNSGFSLEKATQFLNHHSLCPSLQMGLFTLVSSFLAQKEEKSLHHFLFNSTEDRIKVNAVSGFGNQNLEHAVAQFTRKGYTTIKVKVGHEWNRHLPALECIRQTFPSLTIRIDANQYWTLDEAKKNLKSIENLNIEYCEEPLANPDEESLNRLKKTSSVPIALDESLSRVFTLDQAMKLVPVLIIKPMVLGIKDLFKTIQNKADNNKTQLIYTTSLESGIGRLMTATLAAGLGSTGKAHGLGTGTMLANDIWRDDTFVRNGIYHLPNANQLSTLMKSTLPDLPVKKIQLND